MTKPAQRIMLGLREAASHARGEKVPGLKLHVAIDYDPKTFKDRLIGIYRARKR